MHQPTSIATMHVRAVRTFAVLGLAAASRSQSPALDVVVRAGAVDREASPAAGTFAWPEALLPALRACDTDLPVAWQARLVEADTERAVPCEVLGLLPAQDAVAEGTLRFVVGELAAGSERTYRLVLAGEPALPAAATFATESLDEARELRHGGLPLLRHESPFDRSDFDRTSKPIWHLYVPGTDTLLTKGLGGEYPHHRGLFLGWNKTVVGDTELDLWHCRSAGQRHAGYNVRRETQSAVRGEMVTATHWLTPVDAPVVRDHRSLTFWLRPQTASGDAAPASTMLDVSVELASEAVVALRGDPHHAGFQIRVADEVAQRKDARYIRPPEAKEGKDDTWTDCRWVVGLFTIGGHDVAVQHMSHPDNPGPLVYSTRDYGRFGAFCTPDIRPDEPVRLRYRLLVLRLSEGADLAMERFARAFADYAQPMAVEIKGR